MKKITYNFFAKSPTHKTRYNLQLGDPIFGETINLLIPIHLHGRAPAFTMIWMGKHVAGFRPHSGGGYLGNYKGNGLLMFRKENGFDLFVTNMGPVELLAALQTASMVDAMFRARKEAHFINL